MRFLIFVSEIKLFNLAEHHDLHTYTRQIYDYSTYV